MLLFVDSPAILLVPAIFTTVGNPIWWPNKLARGSVRTPELTKLQS